MNMPAKLIAISLAAAGAVSAAEKVTFTETIAPIIYDNCVTCHRPGEAAPFALLSYEDVKKRGSLIAAVTKSRYMPPWHAAHGYGEFDGERRLSDAQIGAIGEWVKQGMAEGDPAKMPKLPQFIEGWHLGKPDLILQMPAAFDLPASGPDIYRNFVIPTGLTEDKWVRAVEFRPSARKVVHHVLYAYVPGGSLKKRDGADGAPGFGGMGTVGVVPGQAGGGLGGWAVGNTPVFLPDGLAWPLPKGSDFILQMHFHLTGKAESERSTIGIYFADKAPDKRMFGVQVPALFGFGSGIDIPAGAKAYTIEDSVTLPVDVLAYSAGGHAHYVGKEMKATATLPDGTIQPLLWIPDWDFAWQDRYNYKKPVVLPKGTRIDVKLTYDNSSDNPRNPSNPPKRVLWGEQSFDEMGSVTEQVVAVHKEDELALQKFLADRTRAAIQAGMQNGTAQRYLQQRASEN
jgi:mono/diheme cytochrome c family protein